MYGERNTILKLKKENRVILISARDDIILRKVTRDKERHYIMIEINSPRIQNSP
jgi:hypothetical protein